MEIVYANVLPVIGERQRLELSFNNRGLDQKERSVWKGVKICLASIFGGTSNF
jgi:hypothetical protein